MPTLNNKPSKRVPNPANPKIIAFKRAEVAKRLAAIRESQPKPVVKPKAKDSRMTYNGATASFQPV